MVDNIFDTLMDDTQLPECPRCGRPYTIVAKVCDGCGADLRTPEALAQRREKLARRGPASEERYRAAMRDGTRVKCGGDPPWWPWLTWRECSACDARHCRGCWMRSGVSGLLSSTWICQHCGEEHEISHGGGY